MQERPPSGTCALAQAMLDHLEEGCVLLGPGQVVLHANLAAARLLRRDRDGLAGQVLPGLQDPFLEAMLLACAASGVPRRFNASGPGGGRLTFQVRPCQEGLFLRIWATNPRLRRRLPGLAGRRHAAGLPREVTAQSLLATMNAGFHLSEAVLDEAGRVVDLRLLDGNNYFFKYFGFHREDVLGRLHSELWPGMDPQWLVNQGATAMTGLPAHFERLSRVTPNAWEVFCFSPAVRTVATFSLEISTRKAAENQLRASHERLATRAEVLEETVRDLDEFTRAIAHDLRAPIRHISGFADLLDREAGARLGERGRYCLDTMRRASANMAGLLERLLELSRSGGEAMVRTWVDLDTLAAEVVATLAPEVQDRAVRWEFAPLPVIHGDRTLLREALANLFSNALKFTRDQAVAHIRVDAREEDGEAVLSVRDNGVGFDPRQAHRLFVVFQRLHAPDRFPGSGVGLANVKRTALRHGGRVWAEAPPGGGAAFFLALPIHPRVDPRPR